MSVFHTQFRTAMPQQELQSQTALTSVKASTEVPCGTFLVHVI